ncbi:MAG: LTA synthase family protein [Desulfobacula sp.]|nr:LTA synthase family protein [Desulfobacula sp.]
MAHKIFSPPKTRFTMLFQVAATALAFFILLRIVFLVREWPNIEHNFFEWIYIFGLGLVYDTAFIGYFCIPFVLLLLILPNRWLAGTFMKFLVQGTTFLMVFGLCFSTVAEWFFWDEFNVRFNFISVDYLIYRREVTNNILQSYPVFWILPVLFLISIFIFLAIRKPLLPALQIKETFFKRMVWTICILSVPILSFLLLDQSQRSYSKNNYTNELASNGPYQLFSAFRNNTLDYRQFYQTGDDQLLSRLLKKQIKSPDSFYHSKGLYNINRRIKESQPAQKLNVILITVESLSARYLTRFGERKNITPFMDKWFKKGLLFTRFYATGTRTVRGLEAVTLSIPPTPGRSIIKRPDNKNMYSLGKIFKGNGYDTAFLYGGRGFFDNMNAFFSGNGYRIIDRTNLTRKKITFENAWGVADEDIFNRAIYEANLDYQLNTPFFFHIMTTSNHQPFTYPEGKIDLPPGEGIGKSGRAGGVKYTDYALSRLITKARQTPWFDNTIFVVLADHCAASSGKVGLPVKKYHIPLFIFGPKYIPAREIDTLSSQIDVAPTLLSLLFFSYDSFFFGKNILSPQFQQRAFIANYQKLGLLNKNSLFILSPQKKINMMNTHLKNPELMPVLPANSFVKEMMSFYQGADYVFRNRLNRFDPLNNNLTKN